MKKLILPASVILLILGGCSSSQKTTAGKKPLVLPAFNKEGHRGARGLMPENIIPSMYKALDYHVNTVEVDIVISKDKKVVISHDVYFHPDITTKPDGQLLDSKEAAKHLLYTMDYDSIKKYDVGLKPHKEFPEQQNIPAYKPLLAELIDSTDAYAKKLGIPIIYNIELKTNPIYDGKSQPPVEETVDLVMQVVKDKKIQGRCYLQSFDFRPLQILHRKYPEITTAVLISDKDKRSFEQQLTDLGYTPEMYSPHHSVVTPELISKCHQRNIRLIPWTVNSRENMKRLKEMGVDGIITDYPNYFAEIE